MKIADFFKTFADTYKKTVEVEEKLLMEKLREHIDSLKVSVSMSESLNEKELLELAQKYVNFIEDTSEPRVRVWGTPEYPSEPHVQVSPEYSSKSRVRFLRPDENTSEPRVRVWGTPEYPSEPHVQVSPEYSSKSRVRFSRPGENTSEPRVRVWGTPEYPSEPHVQVSPEYSSKPRVRFLRPGENTSEPRVRVWGTPEYPSEPHVQVSPEENSSSYSQDWEVYVPIKICNKRKKVL